MPGRWTRRDTFFLSLDIFTTYHESFRVTSRNTIDCKERNIKNDIRAAGRVSIELQFEDTKGFYTMSYRCRMFLLLILHPCWHSNEYYGGLWATFNFDGLQKWMEDLKTSKNNTRNTNVDLQAGEKFLKASDQYSTVENIGETWYIYK